MRWTGRQAVVTLPECIDVSNADCAREQLLLAINRGAAVLIADMTATVSCDYSGTNALVRAYQRAVANGTDLRLVVIAEVVRRVLGVSGLDRLVSVYPTMEAAVAAGAECGEGPGEPATAATSQAVLECVDPGQSADADRADRTAELLDWVVNSIFNVGMSLQAAADLPCDLTSQCITEALAGLDDVVRGIRSHVFAEGSQQIQPGLARRRRLDARERSALTRHRSALLRQRVVQTAHALHAAAADAAALLEQRADLLREPGRIDYRTEIKRWRVLAEQARGMAERWEQRST